MQAERVVLHTDNQGSLIEHLVLAPNATIEAIFLIEQPDKIVEKVAGNHKPAKKLRGAMRISGDIVSSPFPEDELNGMVERTANQLAGEPEAFNNNTHTMR
jgi:hypothetical protein